MFKYVFCPIQVITFDSSVGRAVDCSSQNLSSLRTEIHRSLVQLRLEGSNTNFFRKYFIDNFYLNLTSLKKDHNFGPCRRAFAGLAVAIAAAGVRPFVVVA